VARDISLNALIEWMREEGFFDQILLAHDWNGPSRFSVPQEAYDAVTEVIGAFIATRTMDELIERGMKQRILLAPIYTIPQLLHAEQLAARGFFREVPDQRRGATALHPGPFARLSETPLVDLRRAPEAGADTGAVLAAAGLAPSEISALRHAEVI
jgi:crotonobetainyl-CoA:carnitine CoA-transferase CaiB-like acyl-CoA transferase